MKTISIICFLVLSSAVSVIGQNSYPRYVGPLTSIKDMEKLSQAMLINYAPLAQAYATLKEPSETTILSGLQVAAKAIPARGWPLVSIPERMPLPGVLLDENGLNNGLDCNFRLEALADAPETQTALMAYSLMWGQLLRTHAPKAFSILAEQSELKTVTSLDIMAVIASLAASPGAEQLSEPPLKTDWNRIYQSSNPCYKFLALLYLDQVDQTPEELLELYRVCLFESCSYLETCVLNMIKKRADFREAVAQLLTHYIQSGRTVDDGTMSKIRNPYGERKEAATELVKEIQNYLASHVTGTASPAEKPGPIKHPPSSFDEKLGSKNEHVESARSKVWPLWLVLGGAALSILWLGLKQRR